MTDCRIIRLTADGQLAIPQDLTKGFKGGDALLVMRHDDRLILERLKVSDGQLQEDLEFAKRTRAAWKRYDNGEFRSLPFDEFIEAMAQW